MPLRSRFADWSARFRRRLRRLVTDRADGHAGIEVGHMAELVASSTPTILEIGAHDGGHTLQFLRAFASPEIHCFEPEPRALARLRPGVAGHPRVHVHETAVGETSGRAAFHRSFGGHPGPAGLPLPEGWDYSGSLLRPLNHRRRYPAVTFGEPLEVDVVSIDEWIADRPISTVDLVWIDAQGAEGKILRGMQNTLPRVRFIYTEFSDDEMYEGQPTLEGILTLAPGFRVVERFAEDVLLARE
jgi:FkbM family methyltransferase